MKALAWLGAPEGSEEGTYLPQASPLGVNGYLLVHIVLSLCACLFPCFPFYEDTSQIGLGLTKWPHFNLIISIKILYPN